MASYATMLAVSLISTMSIIFNYSIDMAFGQELEIGAEYDKKMNFC
jgi:hypothetical protein